MVKSNIKMFCPLSWVLCLVTILIQLWLSSNVLHIIFAVDTWIWKPFRLSSVRRCIHEMTSWSALDKTICSTFVANIDQCSHFGGPNYWASIISNHISCARKTIVRVVVGPIFPESFTISIYISLQTLGFIGFHN